MAEDKEIPNPNKKQEITIIPRQLPLEIKALGVEQIEWDVITQQVFPTAKDPGVIGLVVKICMVRKLDIIKKPFHIVPMWNSKKQAYDEVIWASISEAQITATRTNAFAGIESVVFGPKVTLKYKSESVTVPEFATCTVYRMVQGIRCPFSATIYYEERVALNKYGNPNSMWTGQPRSQMDKCARAAVLRIAFPEEVGGDPMAEEMEGHSIDTDEEIGITKQIVNKQREIKEKREATAPPPIDAEEVQEEKSNLQKVGDIVNAQHTDKQDLAEAKLDVALENNNQAAAESARKEVEAAKGLSGPQAFELTKAAKKTGWSVQHMIARIASTYTLDATQRKNWAKHVTQGQYAVLLNFFNATPYPGE